MTDLSSVCYKLAVSAARGVSAACDSVLVESTPIDYLDFASPASGLGSKIGFYATNKWPAESSQRRGRPISMSTAVKQRVDMPWKDLGIH